MKKLLLSILCLVGLSHLNAQELDIIQNKYILGGSFSYLYQKNTYPLSTIGISSIINVPGVRYSNTLDESTNHVFSFSPYLGREINSNWTLGILLQLQLQNTTTKNPNVFGSPQDRQSTAKSLGGGIFARYHFYPQNKLNFFLQPNFSYHSIQEELKSDDTTYREFNTKYFNLGVSLGVLYKFSKTFRTTLRFGGLSYLNGNWDRIDTGQPDSIEKDFSTFNSNFNLSSLFIGIEFSF